MTPHKCYNFNSLGFQNQTPAGKGTYPMFRDKKCITNPRLKQGKRILLILMILLFISLQCVKKQKLSYDT